MYKRQGFLKLSQIWGVFGAANQLLAGIAMLAVATWLGNIGKNNKMFFVPMVFMLAATLTSLDSGTRLARYMFAELFIPEGKTRDDLTGAAKFFSHPLVATGLMVIVGCGMGFMGLSQIWGVFGAANQLLAGIAMLAVATWLGNIGKNNKMFFVPMVFMLAATITALVQTIIKKVGMIGAGAAAWGDWFQMIWSIGLVVLAVILVAEGVKVLKNPAKKEA